MSPERMFSFEGTVLALDFVGFGSTTEIEPNKTVIDAVADAVIEHFNLKDKFWRVMPVSVRVYEEKAALELPRLRAIYRDRLWEFP